MSDDEVNLSSDDDFEVTNKKVLDPLYALYSNIDHFLTFIHVLGS